MTELLPANEVRQRITGGGELAVLDVREEGTFSDGHLLFACSLPLGRIETTIADLVPRRTTPVVLCDGDEGLATRAAERLASFGYTDVAVLDGGIGAWQAAGLELFTGVNVPSKAFGEFVEVNDHTPGIGADELRAKIDAGEDLVVLDSRPYAEYHRMNIPTGIDCPGAELAYRVHDIAPSPDTLVVVNCAGRTRSIIGAQSLINAGIPNRVLALRNGTMGWELAGLEIERGQNRRPPEVTPAGLDKAVSAAARVASRFGIQRIDLATLEAWRAEADRRTLYVFDVRNPEEFEAGHMAGTVSAPGGQLVQATDRYGATRGARIVLVDDTGVRATMTASWLVQMGWRDVAVLDGGLEAGALEAGPRAPTVLGLDHVDAPSIEADALQALLAAGEATVIDLARSPAYRAGHVPGAWWAVRARLDVALSAVPVRGRLVLTSEDGILARLAAGEAASLSGAEVACLAGGTDAWSAAGLALAEGEENLADTTDDVWLRAYDLSSGVEEAMKQYLAWELDLVEQIERDGTTEFRSFPSG